MSDSEPGAPAGDSEPGAPEGDSEPGAPKGATDDPTAPGRKRGPMERSSAEEVPAALLEAVNAAIVGGATVQQIAARMGSEGRARSRSAAGRSAKSLRAFIRRERETQDAIRAWAEEVGAPSGACAGRLAIERLRRMAFSALAEIGRREGPVPVDDLDTLAQVLRRIESIDRLRQARERAEAKAAPGAGQAPRQEGALRRGGRRDPRVRRGQAPRRARDAGAGGPAEAPLNPRCVPHESHSSHANPTHPTRIPLIPRESHSSHANPTHPTRIPLNPGESHLVPANPTPIPACSPSPPLGAERAGERWGICFSSDAGCWQRKTPTSP